MKDRVGSCNSLSQSLVDNERGSPLQEPRKPINPLAAAKEQNYDFEAMRRMDEHATRYQGVLLWVPEELAKPKKGLCERLREMVCGPN